MIKVYTKKGCSHCLTAKTLLEQHNIKHQVFKVAEEGSKDADITRDELLELIDEVGGAKTMPVILLDGQRLADNKALADYISVVQKLRDATGETHGAVEEA